MEMDRDHILVTEAQALLHATFEQAAELQAREKALLEREEKLVARIEAVEEKIGRTHCAIQEFRRAAAENVLSDLLQKLVDQFVTATNLQLKAQTEALKISSEEARKTLREIFAQEVRIAIASIHQQPVPNGDKSTSQGGQ